ncbi:MAG: hypothetical protein R2755_09990 [Acidimicrobiales bacterium]
MPSTSGSGSSRARSPVVDIIEVSEPTRSGAVMASSCATMPPSEAPSTWARSTSSASSSASVSAAMSCSR